MSEDRRGAQATPPRQQDLHLNDLRQVFHEVDRLAAQRLSDREILEQVRAQVDLYELRFLRWLVRHTLHPEAEDDILPDEVRTYREVNRGDDFVAVEVEFVRIPPTVEEALLVQYLQHFWHVIELDVEGRRAVLKPLGACDE